MALKLGAYTACLHDHPLEAALDVLGSNGLTSVEVNTGGFIPSPHCHVDLLSSAQARRERTWRLTSSTRTPATPASTAWPSPPGTSAPPRPRCDGPGRVSRSARCQTGGEELDRARRRPT
jgi:hypothetical protein